MFGWAGSDSCIPGGESDALWPRFRIRWQFQPVTAVQQDFSLDFEKVGLDGRRTTEPPKQGCQPQQKLTLHRGFGTVVRDNGRLERFVVFGVFQILQPSQPSIRAGRH